MTLYLPDAVQLMIRNGPIDYLRSGDSVYFTSPAMRETLWDATYAEVERPFVVEENYVYQPDHTDVLNGGRATYTLNAARSGDYMIVAEVDAPNEGANSLFVNIDGGTTDTEAVWDIEITEGFEERVVSWRGDSTKPTVFALVAGEHKLSVIGREGHVRLRGIRLQSTHVAQSVSLIPGGLQ